MKGLGKGLAALLDSSDLNTNKNILDSSINKIKPNEKNSAKTKGAENKNTYSQINNKTLVKANVKKNDKKNDSKILMADKYFGTEELKEIPIIKINPNPNQPRREFKEDSLKELAESIKNTGIIQPLILTKVNNGKDEYIIVAGERRWRAAKMVGLKSLPAIVRNLDKLNLMKQALIENIQRENLNIIDEAEALKKLKEEHSLTQDDLARETGKSRAHIANILRLDSLSEHVKDLLKKDELSFGHAKVLLSVNDFKLQNLLADKVTSHSLSVRKLETLIKKNKQKLDESLSTQVKSENKSDDNFDGEDIHVKDIEHKLQDLFKTKVKLHYSQGRGYINIEYFSTSELENILEMLKIDL